MLDQEGLRPSVRALVRLLWVTGARISEILAVEVRDVDFRAQLVALPTLKRRRPQKRTIPLMPDVLGEIAVLINAEGMKANARLLPWSRSRAFELIRDALLAGGIERRRCHPHVFRHGHAVHALQNGAPLNCVQRALGHASLTSTSVYLAVTGEDVRRFYSTMDW